MCTKASYLLKYLKKHIQTHWTALHLTARQ
uniref:C2H2-type domain-containing protein n=1 Tax=Anguilla anguilla TaxID=7936 RepID=A0A0E9UE06_ANGAN